MAYREFQDEKGTWWKVWDVTPDERIFRPRTPVSVRAQAREERSVQARSEVTPSRSRGWLAFQSATDSRRLSPIPPGWETANERDLGAFLLQATPVQNRYRA